MADVVDIYESCFGHIYSEERQFLQPPSSPESHILHEHGFPHRPLSLSLFLVIPFSVYSIPSFYLGSGLGSFGQFEAALQPHVNHIFMDSPIFLQPCTNLTVASNVKTAKYCAFLACITAGRCFWRSCTVSIEEILHQRTSCGSLIDTRNPQKGGNEANKQGKYVLYSPPSWPTMFAGEARIRLLICLVAYWRA